MEILGSPGRFLLATPEAAGVPAGSPSGADPYSSRTVPRFEAALEESVLSGALVRDIVTRLLPAPAEPAGRNEIEWVVVELAVTGSADRLDSERVLIELDGAELEAGATIHDPRGDVLASGELVHLRFGRHTIERLGLRSLLPDALRLPDALSVSGPFTVGRREIDIDLDIETAESAGRVVLQSHWFDENGNSLDGEGHRGSAIGFSPRCSSIRM